jgi:small subunit ribosomal protein S20
VANHLQSKKRKRQNIKRAERNQHFRTTMRTFVKRLRLKIEEGEADGAKSSLGIAIQQLDKAVTKGILHRRTASRAISRLTVAVSKLS